MADKTLKFIGIWIFLDGLLSIFLLGSFNTEIVNIFRYVRTGIGVYLFWKFK